MPDLLRTPHPTGGVWVCGTCRTAIHEAHVCPVCGTVLCERNAADPHAYPAGSQQDARCPNSEGQ